MWNFGKGTGDLPVGIKVLWVHCKDTSQVRYYLNGDLLRLRGAILILSSD